MMEKLIESFVYLGLLVILLVGVFRAREKQDVKVKRVCKSCGHVGSPVNAYRGHVLIEIVLWFCLLIPGVIYSIWARGGRDAVCSMCQSKEVIPTDTPIGKKLVNEAIEKQG